MARGYYRVIDPLKVDDLEAALNSMAAEGWRVSAVFGARLIMERVPSDRLGVDVPGADPNRVMIEKAAAKPERAGSGTREKAVRSG